MFNLKLIPLEDRIVLDAALLAALSADPVDPDSQMLDSTDPGWNLEPFVPLVTPNPVSAPAISSPDGVHLMVVSSAVDNLGAFVNASNVETVVYDAAHASFSDILSAIQGKLNGRIADSIAFATEGQAERFNLTNSIVVDSTSLSDSSMQQFWSNVGSNVKEGGRVDLLSCNLTQFSSSVADSIDTLLDTSGKSISLAASSDLSGNTADSVVSDWILERGAIDASYYFDASKISQWNDALATFIVTSKLDSGVGTLRTAITNANSAAGTDTISFNISGAADYTLGGLNGYRILPLTSLPTIADKTIIDGYTQYGFATGDPTFNFANATIVAPLLVEIRGSSASANVNGLTLSGAGSSESEIHGLVINSFINGTSQRNGILITGASVSNKISGNIIGLDPTGTIDLGNAQDGIQISTTSNNIIGGTGPADRNIISGNNGAGVSILSAASSGNQVLGNIIGLDITGTVALGNTTFGVRVSGANSVIRGNIISGNSNHGINIVNAGADFNIVQGNIIGLDITGTVDLGNTTSGIAINTAQFNIIGGTTLAERNIISGNGNHGVVIFTSTAATDNRIIGNIIGLDITGTVDLGNTMNGVQVQGPNNFIGGTTLAERNIISGNDSNGINLTSTSSGTTIKGNIIGLDISGTIDRGNTSDGIEIQASGNLVGGTLLGERNIISGNNSHGILITGSTSTNNKILGNIIGLDITGAVDLGNSANGISISSANNIIGGSAPGEGNIISGNSAGISLGGSTSSLNKILGNIIGLDITGTVAVGNSFGISVGAQNNTVGGSASGEGNIISGNTSAGIVIFSSNSKILGNIIGLDITGTLDRGNGNDGIVVQSSNNIIGGSAPGEGNIVSGNDANGIGIFGSNNSIQGNIIGLDKTGTIALGNNRTGIGVGSGTGNRISMNRIFANGANGELGIDLVRLIGINSIDFYNGITINDFGDADTGVNNLQNFPILSSANFSGGMLTITGKVNTQPGTYTLEFFANSIPTVYSQGQFYLGSQVVTVTDATVDTFFTFTFAPLVTPLPSYSYSATATDSSGNTSEFSHFDPGGPPAPNLAPVPVQIDEDSGLAIPLSINASLVNNDGSATLVIDIMNVPSGATLSAGNNLGGGHWQLSAADLVGLTISPTPLNSDSDITLGITAKAIDSNNHFNLTSSYLFITVDAVADAPNLDFAIDFDQYASIVLGFSSQTNFGGAFAAIQALGLPNVTVYSDSQFGWEPFTENGGQEFIAVGFNTPVFATGATIRENFGNGYVTQVDALDLNGLWHTVWTGVDPSPQGILVDFRVDFTTNYLVNGLKVHINSQDPGWEAIDAIQLHGDLSQMNEDSVIPIRSIYASLVDTGEILPLIDITNVPAGAMLSAGSNLGGGHWQLTRAQLAGLTITPPLNSGDDITLVVTVTSIEPSNFDIASTTKSLLVPVNAVADTPTLSVSNAAGNEDSAIPLNISSSLFDTDGSESLVIDVTSVPAGATLSAGNDLGGGHWQLNPGDLAGLTLTPALNSDADFTLMVSATSIESRNNDMATSAISSLFVDVTAVADAPTLVVSNAIGLDNVPIPLNISSALVDRDGSESLMITISGVPTGAVLSNGFVDQGGGVWTLSGLIPNADLTALNGLTITTPLTFDGPFTLNVIVKSTEAENGDMASTSANINVFVKQRLWGIDKADNQLFSIGDYTNAAATFTDFGTLQYNGLAINGSIESFALYGTKGYFVINSFNAPGSSLNGQDVLAVIDISTAVAGGPNGVTLLGAVNIPDGHRISGLAINPLTGDLFAVQKRGSDTGAGQDSLLILSKVDGHVIQDVGKMMGLGEKSSVSEDLKFDNAGNLFVTDAYDSKTYKISTANGAIVAVVDNNQAGGLGGPVHFTAMAYDVYTNTMIALDDNEDVLAFGITGTNGNNTAVTDLTALGLTSVGGMDFSINVLP